MLRAMLHRKFEEAGVAPSDGTQVSDQQLDDIIRCIKADHANDCEVLLNCHLLRMSNSMCSFTCNTKS